MGKIPFDSKPKTLPKYLTKEEISNILDLAKKDRYRNYILLLAMWRTGMRVSEIVKLKKQDIKNEVIEVKGKGGKDRIIPLESELSNILGLFVDRLKPRGKLYPMSMRQVRNIVYKYSPYHIMERKGKQFRVYDVHPHTFRHSFAVHCLKGGMNIRALQKILGHSNLATTAIYLDVIGKDIIDDFKKVEW